MPAPLLFLFRLIWSAGVVLSSTAMLVLLLVCGAVLLLVDWVRSTAAALRRVWVTPLADL